MTGESTYFGTDTIHEGPVLIKRNEDGVLFEQFDYVYDSMGLKGRIVRFSKAIGHQTAVVEILFDGAVVEYPLISLSKISPEAREASSNQGANGSAVCP